MPDIVPNTAWIEWNSELRTNRELVQKAMIDPNHFDKLMRRHRHASLGYLDWFLLKHKIVLDPEARKAAALQIWGVAKQTLPGLLRTVWSQGNIGFRKVLYKAMSDGYYEWEKMRAYKPGIDGLASPMLGEEEELLRRQREDVLGYARERLRLHSEEKKNQRYAVFMAWEADKDGRRRDLAARLAATGQRLNDDDFRKTLGRAWDQFGRYLADEVLELFGERDDLTVAKFRDACEQLDLMEDYALNSKYCRRLLGLPDDR